MIGIAEAATTRPSGQYMCSSTPTTTSSWATLVIRKISPKPLNRRMLDRSVVTRESSCPDCQCPWKAIGSCCSRS